MSEGIPPQTQIYLWLAEEELYFTDISNNICLETRTELRHIIVLPHNFKVLVRLPIITFLNSVPATVSAMLPAFLNTLHFSLIH